MTYIKKKTKLSPPRGAILLAGFSDKIVSRNLKPKFLGHLVNIPVWQWMIIAGQWTDYPCPTICSCWGLTSSPERDPLNHDQDFKLILLSTPPDLWMQNIPTKFFFLKPEVELIPKETSDLDGLIARARLSTAVSVLPILFLVHTSCR